VLFLDADEILSPAVKREIAAALPGTTHQGFLLSYINYFLCRCRRPGECLRRDRHSLAYSQTLAEGLSK
jgi:hypothetical protein